MVRISGFCDSAQKLSSHFESVDVFIAGISYEERYIRGHSLLGENGIQAGEKILFYFNEVLTTYNRTDDEARFDSAFAITSADKKLYVDLYDEVKGLFTFRRYLNENLYKFLNKNIIIDFSVMVKPYFFLLMKHLSSIKTKKLGFLYTEPDAYESITRGAMATKDMPGYSGARTLRKKDALAILLGFEGNRAVAVYDEIDPDLTIPINGFPSYKPEFKDISILRNKELLMDEEIFKNLRFAPANDPFDTKDALHELYLDISSEYNLSIAPLGSKPMALGSCFFAMEQPDCRVIYPYPQEYLPKSSKGWRNSWIYVTELAESDSCGQA
jgi:hypothetical protein